jgi:LysM repeat protein
LGNTSEKMTSFVWKMILGVPKKKLILFFYPVVFIFIATYVAVTLSGCATSPKRMPVEIISSGLTGQKGFPHTVERGQTLYRIAKFYHVEASDLLRVNQIPSPSRLYPGSSLWIPQPSFQIKALPLRPAGLEEIRRLVGPKNYAYPWKTITLHHSATRQGSARLFDRDHRRRGMGGLFYHFVIGNGAGMPDGVIEAGRRWREQVKANRPYDIQICLVGNFDEQYVSKAQLESLVILIHVLREQYLIPFSIIRGHRDIYGKHTQCPGSHFPLDEILKELSY